MGLLDEASLSPRQAAQYAAQERIASAFGKWDTTTGADGSHYAPARANPFVRDGLICANCSFYEDNGSCEIVNGPLTGGAVEPNAVCKLWIIPVAPTMDEQNLALGAGLLALLPR